MTTRRGFLTSCLAMCAAPAIVRADSLMRVVARDAVALCPWEVEGARLIGMDFAVEGSSITIANNVIIDSCRFVFSEGPSQSGAFLIINRPAHDISVCNSFFDVRVRNAARQ